MIDFTPRGETAFTELTRELARRGAAEAAPDADMEAGQHFAMVIDDRIVATPYIGFREAPDGIDGSAGFQLQGDITADAARLTAAILGTGPLPAALSSAGA